MHHKIKIFFNKYLLRKYSVIVISGIFVSNFSSPSIIAQQNSPTASAKVNATIVIPIGITKIADMNFGNVAVSTTSGTLILDPGGTRSATGGITLPTVTGTVTAASFQVTGEDSYAYTITLPTEAYTITRISGSETMLINNFTSSPSGSGTLTAGVQTILVGATLIFDAEQPASQYKGETGFNVTVNYN